MKQEARLGPAVEVPRWSAVTEARAKLEEIVRGFVEAAAAGTANDDDALALKVTAGLGKTATTLRAIVRYGEALLARGHVLFYVPTLELAERAQADLFALAPDLPSRVVRGRHALRPGGTNSDPDEEPEKMCKRADLADKIAGFVPSVTQALCRGVDSQGQFVQSDCAAGCPYLEQKDIPGPHVVFLSHAYLTVDPPIDRDYPITVRIIDEKVWPTLIRTSYISVDDYMRAQPHSFPQSLYGDLTLTKARVIEGLEREMPLHAHLRGSGIPTKRLERLAHAEKQSRSYLEIGPWQSDKARAFHIDIFDTKSFITSRQSQRILELLSEKEDGHCVGLRLSEIPTETGSYRAIEISNLAQVPRDAPLLLLDADADREITERIAEGCDFVSIQSPPIADIVQVSDLTLSNSWLLHPKDGVNRRASVLSILKREVEKSMGGGTLVVATKSVLAALHGDLGKKVSKDDDKGLKQPILGADPLWFGPRTQGVNDFERYSTIVVVGRLQPGIIDVEKSARALFAKDANPLIEHACGPLPASDGTIMMEDGSTCDGVVRSHPEPRSQVVLAQTRECGTLQAIARLRLLSPNRDKRVVILSNLPLPEFPITRLSTFAALERGLEQESDWRGFVRMEAALRAKGTRPVLGTRLSSTGLATDLPRDFATVSGAKRFRRGRSTADLISLCQRVAAANGWKIAQILLRRTAGGKAIPAIVFEDHGEPLALARTLWPDFTAEPA